MVAVRLTTLNPWWSWWFVGWETF